MTATVERVSSLDEALQQQARGFGKRTGKRSAEEMVAGVIRLYGEDEVRAWAADLFLEVAHWRARQIEGVVRRANERDREQRPDEPGVMVAYLRDPVRVPVYDGDGLGDFKTVARGEMTEEDHVAVIRYRSDQIRALQRGIDLHERDLWLIRHYKVSCLNELPPDALAQEFEEAA